MRLTRDARWTVEGARAEDVGVLAATVGIPLLELLDKQTSRRLWSRRIWP
ncbi:hypothetical protein ACOBQB_12445 [Streptomyces sp. G5(2025)]